MKILATVILQASLIRYYLNFLKNLIIIINYYYYYYSFLILFVFMFWLLFITVISAVRWATTNDQRITGYPRLYISNTFLSILAVPNKALSCITPTLHVMPTLSRAPITTGTISIFLLVLFHFFFFFFLYSYISWYGNVCNYSLLLFLVNNY